MISTLKFFKANEQLLADVAPNMTELIVRLVREGVKIVKFSCTNLGV